MPPAPTTTTPANHTTNYGHENEHVGITIVAAPFRFLQNSYRHLSSIRGFGLIATTMSLYCAGLSIEAVMVATPVATGKITGTEVTEEMKRSRRFMPKPYVNDGAELGRLNPLPNIQNAVLQKYFQWLPMWIKGRVQSDYWTVWNAPGTLLLSVVIALTIQRYESMIWRKKSKEKTLEEFNEANKVKQVAADPNAIALAAYKAQQHNTQGTGSVLGTFAAVVLLYGLEIAAFFGSFSGAGAFVVNAVYAFLTICGFEIFDRQTPGSEEK